MSRTKHKLTVAKATSDKDLKPGLYGDGERSLSAGEQPPNQGVGLPLHDRRPRSKDGAGGLRPRDSGRSARHGPRRAFAGARRPRPDRRAERPVRRPSVPRGQGADVQGVRRAVHRDEGARMEARRQECQAVAGIPRRRMFTQRWGANPLPRSTRRWCSRCLNRSGRPKP